MIVIQKLDDKTFLFNGDAKPIGYKCYSIGDLVSVDGIDFSIGGLFYNISYKDITINQTDGTKIIAGTDSGKTAVDIVQAINNIVNFSGGSGVGALTIAKKLDGTDAVFPNLAALQNYYTTNPTALPSPGSAAVVGTANADGTVATITMPYVWNSNTKTWDSAATNFKGDKGDKGDTGDPSTLIDDTQALQTKVYSSSKVESKLVEPTKEFGTDGRLRFNTVNDHFYFEVFQNGQWITKAEIGKSIIVDALRLIKGVKPTDLAAEELGIYNKEITLADNTKTIRPTIVFSSGNEYGLVVHNEQNDKVGFRRPNGELIDIPYWLYDKNGVKYENLTSLKFVGSVSVALDSTDNQQLIINVTGSGSTDTPIEIRDKLESLGGDERLDVGAIKNAIRVREDIYINFDLLLDASNYKAFGDGLTVLTKANTNFVQNVFLPVLNIVKDYTIFTFYNNRGEGGEVDIIAAAGESIDGQSEVKIKNGEHITIEKIKVGKEWIILSRYEKTMDGGSIQ